MAFFHGYISGINLVTLPNGVVRMSFFIGSNPKGADPGDVNVRCYQPQLQNWVQDARIHQALPTRPPAPPPEVEATTVNDGTDEVLVEMRISDR